MNNEDNNLKPKVYRDRKKHPSKEQQRRDRQDRIEELHHPVHKPYERKHKNWTKEALEDEPDTD